jgi:hypothetical protein
MGAVSKIGRMPRGWGEIRILAGRAWEARSHVYGGSMRMVRRIRVGSPDRADGIDEMDFEEPAGGHTGGKITGLTPTGSHV